MLDQTFTLPFENLVLFSLCAVVAGLYMLIKCGGWTIDSAVAIAARFKISPAVIAFTIIAFGTSLPELIVSVNSNLKGFPGLSIGNVVGSNVANILLVIGSVAVLVPLKVRGRDIRTDAGMLVLSTAILIWLSQQDVISQTHGGLMFALLLSYVIYQYRRALKSNDVSLDEDIDASAPIAKAFLLLFSGLVGVALGAEILVRGSVQVASAVGVSEAVIGMTIVAFGTSLPELVTCTIAAKRKQADIVIGNIVGSAVFNILSIIGITALISPIVLSAVNEKLLGFDMAVLGIISVIFATLLAFKMRIGRAVGIVMLVLYAAFIIDQYYSSLF